MAPMSYRPDIQVLRGIAVLLVVVFHLAPGVLPSGFIGVDIFFVISGFLMRALYVRSGDDRPAIAFLIRRFNRIFPAYLTTIAVSLAVGSILLVPTEFMDLATQAMFAVLLVPNLYFWSGQSYFDDLTFRPLLHLWSLGVELHFYLLVPAFYYFIHRIRSVFFLVALGSFLACLLIVGLSPKTAFFIVPFRLWEFLTGFAVAHYFSSNGNIIVRSRTLKLISFVALICLCGAGLLHTNINAHPGLFALCCVLLTGLVLGVGLPGALLQTRPSVWVETLGTYSYSMYLVHYPVLLFSYHEPLSAEPVSVKPDLRLAVVLVAIGLLTYVLHNVIEKRSWLGAFRSRTSRKLMAALTVTAGVALCFVVNRAASDDRETAISNALGQKSYWRCGKLHKLRTTFDSALDVCDLNEALTSSDAVLLVGDSHADSVKISLAASAARHAYHMYFMAESCNVGQGDCAVDNIERLITQHRIGKVVLHDVDYNFYKENVGQLKTVTDRLGVELWYIDPVPTYKYSVPRYLLVQHRTGMVDPDFQRQGSYYASQFDGIYKGLDDLHVRRMPTLEYLCTPTCLVSRGDQSYYFDSHHLTLSGSGLLEPMFDKYLFSSSD